MKTRLLSYLMIAVAIVTYVAPAVAQECDLEPPVALRGADVVYVPNRTASTISVIDVTPGSACEFQVVETIALNTNSAPTSVFIRPDGRFAFIVQSSRNSVSVVSTRLGTELFQVPIAAGSGTLAGTMSPDGKRLYVSNLLLGSISVVDTENGLPVGSDIFLGANTYPIGLAVSPDGTQLWATTEFPGAVVVIDIRSDANTITQTIPLPPIVDPLFTPLVPPAAVDVAFDTSGATDVANVIAIGRENAATVFGIINLPDALYRIPVDYDATTDGPVVPILYGDYNSPFGPGAAEVIVSRAGNTWISNAGVLDPSTNTPIPDGSGNYTDYVTVVQRGSATPVAVKSGFSNDPSALTSDNLSPIGLAKNQADSAAGDQIYAVNFTSNTLAIFDAASGGLAAVVPVGNGPVTPYQQYIPPLPGVPVFDLSGASCGQTIPLVLGDSLTFDVTVTTDAIFDDEDDLTLSATGLPDPGVMNPELPINGEDSLSSTFLWQPLAQTDIGTYVMTYTAVGTYDILTSDCQVTLNVTLPPPPVFTEPTNGDSIQVTTGEELSFDVTTTTSYASGFVILDLLDGTSLPGTATMTPELPTDGSGTTATSNFYWLPELGDEGVYTVTWTGTDGFGQETENYVTIEVIEPGSLVPFDPCVITKLHVHKKKKKRGRHEYNGDFDFRGAFGLGDASDGIDPLTEDVTIGLDDFSLVIPAGSFRLKGRDKYKFNGTIDGVRINAELRAPHDHKKKKNGKPHPHSMWSYKFKGKYADMSSVENLVDTWVQVGDDYCADSYHGKIHK